MNIKEIKNISNKDGQNKKTNPIISLIKGALISIIITLIILLIFSLILVNTNIAENTMIPVITIITAVSIILGGIISSKNIEKRGIVNGAITGLIYILAIYLLSSIIQHDFEINIYSIILIIVAIIAGMFGGVIGVNMKSK